MTAIKYNLERNCKTALTTENVDFLFYCEIVIAYFNPTNYIYAFAKMKCIKV